MTHGHKHMGPMYDGARCRAETFEYVGTGVAQNITFIIKPDVVMIFGQRLGKFYHIWDKKSDDSWRSGSIDQDPGFQLDIIGVDDFTIQVDLACNVSPIVYNVIGYMVSPSLDTGYEMNYYTPGFHKHLTGMEDLYKGRLWTDSYVGDVNVFQDKNMVFEPGYLIIIDHDDELVYHTINAHCGVSVSPLYTLLEGYNVTAANRILNVVIPTLNSGIVNLGGELNQDGHIYTYINFGGYSSYNCEGQKGGGGVGHFHKGGWDTYHRTLMGTFQYTGNGNASANIYIRDYLATWNCMPDFVIIFGEQTEISGDLNLAFKFWKQSGRLASGPYSTSTFYEGPSPGAGVDHEGTFLLYTNAGQKIRLKLYETEKHNTSGVIYNVWLIKLI